MNWWKRITVAAFVAFLYYFCQIAANASESHRYHTQWDFTDFAAVWLGIALCTAVLAGIDMLVTRSKSPLLRRLANHAFLFVVVGQVLAICGRVFMPLYVVQTLWMAAIAAIGYSFAKPQWRLDCITAKICLVFSPAIVLFAIQMSFWSTWPNPREPRPAALFSANEGKAAPVADDAKPKKRPVFFFVFDEWSFLRIGENGEIKNSLKNLHELAGRSVTFTHALSPAPETNISLPRLIYQTDKAFHIVNADTFFGEGDARVPTREMPSLFQKARREGYATSIFGFYHAYRQMLGDQVDYCHVFPCNCPPRGFGNVFLWRLHRDCRFFNDPLSVQIDIGQKVASRQWYEMCLDYRREMLDLLADSAPNTFAFFHAPWPHDPFVFNPDGSYFGAKWELTRPGDYMRHLDYLDAIVGDIAATLKTAGKFDDATLIITSDHSWRSDSDPTFRDNPKSRRVPLIIKLPGGKTGRVIEKEFCTNRLQPLLEAVFAGEQDIESLLKLL